MRKTGLMLATMAVALLLGSGVALAEVFSGDGDDDGIVGTDGRDRMSGGGGDDLMRGLDGSDRMYGGSRSTFFETGEDTMYGGRGEDFINGADGEDHIYGGPGGDGISSIGDNAVDYVDCGAGTDYVNRQPVLGPDKADVFVDCERSVG